MLSNPFGYLLTVMNLKVVNDEQDLARNRCYHAFQKTNEHLLVHLAGVNHESDFSSVRYGRDHVRLDLLF